MGVPGLYGWIKKNYRTIIKNKYTSRNTSTLIIDMNTLIHNAAQYALGYGEWAEFKKLEYEKKQAVEIHSIIVKQIKQKIVELYEIYKPSDALIMAIDGCTSYAKLNQQRERRLGKKEGEEGFKNWSGLRITVGTEFMDKLQLELVDLVDEGLIKAKNIVISPFQSKGEGEHKAFDIFYKLRDIQAIGNGNILFYGMDADIILLCIAKRTTNIIGVRSKVEKLDRDGIEILQEKIEYLHINELYEGLLKDYSFNREVFAEDFTAIMCLLGNDFVPRMVEFSDFQSSLTKLLKTYKKASTQLVFNYGNKSVLSVSALTYLLSIVNDDIEYLELRGSEYLGEKLNELIVNNKAERSYKTILQTIESENKYKTDEDKSRKFVKMWHEKMTYLTSIKNSIKSPLIERESTRKSIQKLIDNFDMKLAIKELINNWFTIMNWICTLYINGMKYVNPECYYRFHLPPLIKSVLEYVGEYEEEIGFDNLEKVNMELIKYDGSMKNVVEYNNQFWLNPAIQLRLALPLNATVASDLSGLLGSENVRYLYPQQGKYKENPDIVSMYGKLQSILPMPMPEGIIESAKNLRINVSRYAIANIDTTRYESKQIETVKRTDKSESSRRGTVSMRTTRRAPRIVSSVRKVQEQKKREDVEVEKDAEVDVEDIVKSVSKKKKRLIIEEDSGDSGEEEEEIE